MINNKKSRENNNFLYFFIRIKFKDFFFLEQSYKNFIVLHLEDN